MGFSPERGAAEKASGFPCNRYRSVWPIDPMEPTGTPTSGPAALRPQAPKRQVQTMADLATGLSADVIASLFDASPDYVLVLSPEGRLLAANRTFRHGAIENPFQAPALLAETLDASETAGLDAALAQIGEGRWATCALRHAGRKGRGATVEYTLFACPQAPGMVLAAGRPTGGAETLDDRVRSLLARASEMDGRVERVRERLVEDQEGGVSGSLPSRWDFGQILAREWDRASRLGLVVSLFAIDVDGLRHVNEAFGQREGDRVLKGLADRLQGQIRSYDVLARTEGGGFLLMTVQLPSDGRSAAAFGRRVHDVLTGEPVALEGGKQARVAISVGGATAAPSADPRMPPEKLREAAAEALSAATRAGGNQVYVAATPATVN